MTLIRVFQIALRDGGGGGKYSEVEGEWEILLGAVFYQVLEIWGGVNLTIRTFFKVKNIILIINNEYDLKSKLERPV